MIRRVLIASAVVICTAGQLEGQAYLGPGKQGSTNMKIMAHLPLGGFFQINDIEIEQELSRPYVYVSRRKNAGFYVLDIKNLNKTHIIYSWQLENPELHQGRSLGATGPAYFKARGRYYYAQSFQFDMGGPDADLGAILFDVTSLPDTTKVKELARVRVPEAPNGFHEIFAYKHSDGRALMIATTNSPNANFYDVERLAAGDPGLVVKIPVPGETRANTSWHDFYAGYDPSVHQDKFYASGTGGYYVFDITRPEQFKLVTSVTGVAGVQYGHTFTPDPTGRYAVVESEYQYAPLRIMDLKPGLDGTVKTISRPIGAWTARWKGLPHNHEVRWPYVFVSTYEDGVYVFNMMDPTNPYTVGYYDTFDGADEQGSAGPGSVTQGSFGIDVRNADGLIVTSDMTTGFWALKMDGFDGWNGHQWGVPNVSSVQDWDNGPEGAPKPGKVS